MKTFFESLTVTKNTKLLQQLVSDLEGLGINHNDFLDWYLREGISLHQSNLLVEGFDDWALEEGIFSNLANRWVSGKQAGQSDQQENPVFTHAGKTLGGYAEKGGKFLGAQIGKARDAYQSFSKGISDAGPQGVGEPARVALSDLSSRLQRSRDLSAAVNDPEFGRQIIDLISRIRTLRENVIEDKLLILSSIGLDVEDLVEWFSNERVNFNEGIGSWFQKAGNWLSNKWDGIKRGWNDFKQGPMVQGFKQAFKQAGEQKDKKAVDNAIKALSALKQKHGTNVDRDFLSLLNGVLSKLSSVAAVEAPGPSDSDSAAPGLTVADSDSDSDLSMSRQQQSVSGARFAMAKKGIQQDGASLMVGNPYIGGPDDPLGTRSYQVRQADDNKIGQRYEIGNTEKLTQPWLDRHPKGAVDSSGEKIGGRTIAKDPNFGRTSINASTEHDSDENKKFLESLLIKENKFSWFG
jgi:hypothetical protein